MKVEWEEHDVIVGTIVSRDKDNERWMIGYNAKTDSEHHYALISMRDGMISHIDCSVADMATLLNASQLQPIVLFKG